MPQADFCVSTLADLMKILGALRIKQQRIKRTTVTTIRMITTSFVSSFEDLGRPCPFHLAAKHLNGLFDLSSKEERNLGKKVIWKQPYKRGGES